MLRGGACDLQLRLLEVVGVEVGQLDLGDLGHLGVGDRSPLSRPGAPDAFSTPAA